MKKPFGSSFATGVLLFAGMLVVTVWAGRYSQSLRRERGSFEVVLGAAADARASRSVMVDLMDQGWPKRLAQPHQISLTTGHRGGISNQGDQPVWVEIRAEGFPGRAIVSSTDPGFDRSTGRLTRPLKPRAAFSASVDLQIPKERLKRREVGSGVIRISDYKTGKLLSTVLVQVVNSAISGCEACGEGDTRPCANRQRPTCNVPSGI